MVAGQRRSQNGKDSSPGQRSLRTMEPRVEEEKAWAEYLFKDGSD